jgi:hypothetical protein
METAAADSQFVIAGPVINEEQTWWNNDQGWVDDFFRATTLPVDILLSPLPLGATGILRMTMEGKPLGFVRKLNPSSGEGSDVR